MKQPIFVVIKTISEGLDQDSRGYLIKNLVDAFGEQHILIVEFPNSDTDAFEIVTARQISQEESDKLIKTWTIQQDRFKPKVSLDL